MKIQSHSADAAFRLLELNREPTTLFERACSHLFRVGMVYAIHTAVIVFLAFVVPRILEGVGGKRAIDEYTDVVWGALTIFKEPVMDFFVFAFDAKPALGNILLGFAVLGVCCLLMAICTGSLWMLLFAVVRKLRRSPAGIEAESPVDAVRGEA